MLLISQPARVLANGKRLHTQRAEFPPPCESAASQYRVGLIRFASGRVLVFHGGVFGCSSRMNGKPSSPVLRGLGASNGARLLAPNRVTSELSVIRPWIVDHALFVPQRYHRIDPRCPSRRDVGGQRRHGDQQRRNAEKCRGIVDANSIQHAGKEACQQERSDCS